MNHKEDNLSNEELWTKIYGGFRNKICNSCCKHIVSFRDMSYPQPLPYVGPDFGKDDYKLMFVGIETYCNNRRDNCEETEYDVFPTEQVKSLFFEMEPENNGYSPFWKWVRRISEQVLQMEAEDAFKHIAYSNLHKCQSRKRGGDFCSSDYAIREELSVNCIQKAGWIYHEIEKIGAKNIIVFSGRAHKCLLARIFLGDIEGTLMRRFDYNNFGSTHSRRRDLFVHLRDEARRFILTNHPQGTPHEIRDEIIRIIRQNDLSSAENWSMPTRYQSA